MRSLYKYLPQSYAEDYVRKGKVLFRSLSYFRDYEDAQVRGDEFEGTRLHRPQNGLEITRTETQEKIFLPHSFESSVNADDIFVFCLSTVFSANLASQFQADACVEIMNPTRFISGVLAALLRRPSIKNKMLVHDDVRYYTPAEPVVVDWALPEKIALAKLIEFAPQQEYRLAFAVNGAFDIENTRCRLVGLGKRSPLRTTIHSERLLKIGNLTKICKTHHFS